MRVFSVFDGLSCVRLALRKNGIESDYFASEIDEHAIKITAKNFADTKQVGDITKLRNGDLPRDIDLLIGGSPCQGLSSANNKGEGLKDKRSALFFRFVEVLNIIKPRYFVLENVRPKIPNNQTTMTNLMGVHPVMLDAQAVSAQRRKRLFWTNIPNVKKPRLVPSHIFPENKIGLVIADILEPDAERRIVKVEPERLIKTSYGYRWNQNNKKQPQGMSAQETKEKDFSLVSSNLKNKSFIVRSSNYGLQGNYAVESKNKHNALINSNLRGNVNVVIDHNSQQNRAFDTLTKHGTLPAARTTSKTIFVFDDLRIEQLTWTEIERLQGLPDGYTDLGAENRVEARGRAIGNGFQVDIVAHLLSFMKGNPEPVKRSREILIGEQNFLFEDF